jgi:polyisoprenoid-binding protein YceI
MTTGTLHRQDTVIPSGAWKVDPAHSKIGFAVRHMGVATVRGEFREFDGALEIGQTLAESRAYGTIKTGSVDTNQDQRDADLRSDDFFAVETYPEMSFESTEIERLDDERLRIVGDLTLHGVKREVELEAELGGVVTGPEGEQRVGLEVTGQLSRREFGMRFDAALGSGNAVVSDKVKLALDITAVRGEDGA